jgi:hypothetical protein
MKWLLAAVTVISLAAHQDAPQDKPRVPKDSLELVIIGCLTGRALRASDVRLVDTRSGPDVRSRTFRLAGKRDVMSAVAEEDGHLVEVTGLVKRSALDEQGMKVGKRVEINGGSPVSRPGIPGPADTVPVMDVSSIRRRASTCGG